MKKAIPVFTALLLTASYFSAEAQTRVHLSRQPAASEQQPAGQQIIAQKKPVTVNDDEANAWRETRYQTTTLHLTPEQEQKVYGIDLAFFKKLSERRTAGDPLSSSEHREMVAEKEQQLKTILTANQYQLTTAQQGGGTASSGYNTSSNK